MGGWWGRTLLFGGFWGDVSLLQLGQSEGEDVLGLYGWIELRK